MSAAFNSVTTCIAAALLLSVGTGHAGAGDLRVATQNMKLAMELCLRNYRSVYALPELFAGAGYRVNPGLDPGVHEFTAPGVFGGFQEGYCYIQSQDVPLAIAEDMGQRLAEALFPGQVGEGNPELPVGAPVPLCDGLSVFAPQSLIRITYSAAGNSGECINDGSSAVILNM